MLRDVNVFGVNEVHVKIVTEPSIAQELADEFKYEIPNAKWHPKVRAGFWDGKIELFKPMKPIMYRGLISEIYEFCRARRYTVHFEKGLVPVGSGESDDFLAAWASSALKANDKTVRDYQHDAFLQAVRGERHVFLSSTSSGKTLMIYLLARWYAEKTNKPTLVLTTRTNLVKQAVDDIEEYSDGETIVKGVGDGDTRATGVESEVLVSTWQSAQNADQKWFENFGCIIADEAHSWDSGAFIKIAEMWKNNRYRFGFTGTLDGSKVNAMILKGIFGPIVRVSSNAERIADGTVAKPVFHMTRLVYPDEDKKLCAKFGTNERGNPRPMDYSEEVEHVITHERRRNFILKLIDTLEGNTLILFNRNEAFGIPMYERAKELFPHKNVSLVYGAVGGDERIAIQKLMEVSDDNQVWASLGTFSEGMSVNNIRNVVFGFPMKQSIRVLQSVGRGIRKMEGKDVCHFYDLVDDLVWKRHDNYCWKHAMIRCEVYAKEGFEYSWDQVRI